MKAVGRLRFVFLGVALPALLLSLGGALTWFGWHAWQQARATADWVPVQGEVLEATLQERRNARSFGRSGWLPRIRYSYFWQGAIMRSNRFEVWAPRGLYSKEEAETILADHPVGAPVTVYRDPSPDGSSVLRRGDGAAPWGLLLPGLGLAVCGIALAVGARHRRRRLLAPD